jgi:molecular chaperone GrpE
MEEKFMQDERRPEEMDESLENATDNAAENEGSAGTLDDEGDILKKEIDELKDKYVRLVADFDNFRKRNAKERLDLIQTASKDVLSRLLPVLDDTERAEKQMQTAQDTAALREGVSLVFNKLRSTLQSAGLKPMESVGKDFNPEFHDAITEVPAPNPALKGKVLDEVEKGYYLNDKIIRFAKVVVGK